MNMDDVWVCITKDWMIYAKDIDFFAKFSELSFQDVHFLVHAQSRNLYMPPIIAAFAKYCAVSFSYRFITFTTWLFRRTRIQGYVPTNNKYCYHSVMIMFIMIDWLIKFFVPPQNVNCASQRVYLTVFPFNDRLE